MNAKSLSPLYRLLVLSGQHKGTTYELISDQITIGRDADNDIVIDDDPRCSRKHAVIHMTDQGLEIRDLSQKNKITVNDEKLDQAILKHGELFIVGSTEMKIELINPPPAAPAAPPVPLRPLPVNPVPPPIPRPPPAPWTPPPGPGYGDGRPYHAPARPPTNPQNRLFYYIVGAVVIVGIWLMSSGSKKTDEEVPITTDSVLESRLEELKRETDNLRQEKDKLNLPQYQQAQSLFVQGFRDYRKGQYLRAMESFRGALAIFPDHKVANRYLTLAKRRFDEEIQFHMLQGRQYKERNMFQKCVASFQLALVMIADPSSLIYKEAKANKDECNLRLDGRY